MCAAALGTLVGLSVACVVAMVACALLPYVNALLEPRR